MAVGEARVVLKVDTSRVVSALEEVRVALERIAPLMREWHHHDPDLAAMHTAYDRRRRARRRRRRR